MPINKLTFAPGINREGTEYAEKGGWYDCDNVRFRSGNPEKIGGWERTSDTNFKGVCRAMMNWTLLDGTDCIALGTHKKFYIENNNLFYDITPLRTTAVTANPITSGAAGGTTHTYTVTAAHGAGVGDIVVISNAANVDGICTSTYTNPFKTSTAGSTYITVTTPTPHYALVNQIVTISGATGFDGIPSGNFNTSFVVLEVPTTTSFTIAVATGCTVGLVTGGGTVTAVFLDRLNREFEIVAVPSVLSFTFTTDTPCTAGAVTGGGATVSAAFQISVGQAINFSGTGWGAGTWSRGTWSSAFTSAVVNISLRIWSISNFGEDLVFCVRGGAIYYWDATTSTGSRAVLLSSLTGASDVPAKASIVMTTDDRHVLAIGCTDRTTGVFDPLLIRWSDDEDAANWTPSITNTAGAQRIPLGSYAVAAIVSRQETLIWTERSLHSLQFSGPPYTFDLQTLAERVSIAGPNAAANVNSVTYWMGKDRFWTYSGRVEELDSTVQRYVFDNINIQQMAQVYAAVNDGHEEITWFYCSASSDTIDRSVSYDYGENLWVIGSMARTAYVNCQGRGGYPFATYGGYPTDNGLLLMHERGADDGTTNPASPINAYIESSDFDIGDGDSLMFVDRVIPDVTFGNSTASNASLTLSVEAKNFPGDTIKSTDTRTVAKTVSGTVDEYTKQVWVRIRGRHMRVKYQSTAAGVNWLLGALRINSRTDGKQ